MAQILDTPNYDPNQEKQRHGCVTAWLVLIIVLNSLVSLGYLFRGDMIAANLPGNPSVALIMVLGVVAIFNVVCAALLLQWKKIGFYGFAVSVLIAFVINIAIGIEMTQTVAGLAGVAVLYAVLQIKGKNGRKAWDQME